MANKRTELMIAEDRAKVCELMARGYRNRSEMARMINHGRDEKFHISAQQVAKDIKAMEDAYMEKGIENLQIAKHQALDELYYLLRMYYESFERSRVNKVTIESQKTIENQEDYDEIMEGVEEDFIEGVHPFDRQGKVKEEYRAEGNPAFLNGAKGVLDSIHKIKNVDGVSKVALTDPSGTEEYMGIAEMMKQQIKELSAREAPTDTDEKLLDAAPEEEIEDDE
jgi:hypothetical protein